MARLIITPGQRERHHRRPSVRGLNFDSPLTRGLLNYWPLVGPMGYRDARSGVGLTPSSGHAYEWGCHPTLGHSLYLGAVGNSVLTSTSGVIAAPWSFHVWWHRIATGATGSYFTSNDTGFIFPAVKGEQTSGSGAVGFSSSTGGEQFLTGITAPTTRAVPITYTTLTGASVVIYIDGVLQGTISTGGTPSLALPRIGNIFSTLDRPPLGWWGGMGVWTRALTAMEVFRMADPPTRWELEWAPSNRSYSFSKFTQFLLVRPA